MVNIGITTSREKGTMSALTPVARDSAIKDTIPPAPSKAAPVFLLKMAMMTQGNVENGPAIMAIRDARGAPSLNTESEDIPRNR